jgi:hypothetical protein
MIIITITPITAHQVPGNESLENSGTLFVTTPTQNLKTASASAKKDSIGL